MNHLKLNIVVIVLIIPTLVSVDDAISSGLGLTKKAASDTATFNSQTKAVADEAACPSCPKNQKSEFLCVFARTRDDHQSLSAWLEHYRYEGVSHFILIDDRSEPPLKNTTLGSDPSCKIVRHDLSNFMHGREAKQLNFFLHHTKPCEWVFAIDTDEFATTRRRPNLTIADELRTTYATSDQIRVPWIMFASDPSLEVVSDPRIQLTMRANYSANHSANLGIWASKTKKREKHIENGDLQPGYVTHVGDGYKSIFRPEKVRNGFVSPHDVDMVDDAVKSVKIRRCIRNGEESIASCELAINHYRFEGRNQIRNKCVRGRRNFQSSYSNAAEHGIDNCVSIALNSSRPEVSDLLLRQKTLERQSAEKRLDGSIGLVQQSEKK